MPEITTSEGFVSQLSPLLFTGVNRAVGQGHSGELTAPVLLNKLTPQAARWQDLNAEIWQLPKGSQWDFETGGNELCLVILGGVATVTSNRGEWRSIGRRADVFSGMPTALYLPSDTKFTVVAESSALEFAAAWVPVDFNNLDSGRKSETEPRLIAPEDVTTEIRGGHHATRQINNMISPGQIANRLVCVEVFTPGGNWSSYPPHKHDTHTVAPDGTLLEADLEEIYFYKIKQAGNQKPDEPSNGYAIQRVYTDKDKSGHRRLDETITVHNNDLVIIPEGYHPVSAALGYDCYYLNFLAGSAQTLMASDDPEYAWIKSLDEYQHQKDPRVPLVTLEMTTLGKQNKELQPV